jgi:hypothetical protein
MSACWDGEQTICPRKGATVGQGQVVFSLLFCSLWRDIILFGVVFVKFAPSDDEDAWDSIHTGVSDAVRMGDNDELHMYYFGAGNENPSLTSFKLSLVLFNLSGAFFNPPDAFFLPLGR